MMSRLFIALEIPSEIKQRLASFQFESKYLKWTIEENYHMTLYFLGEMTQIQAEIIDEILEGIQGQSFDLSLSHLDCFMHKNYVSILWAAVEKTPLLFDLQDHIAQALYRENSIETVKKKFVPHITLARAKKCPFSVIDPFLQANQSISNLPFATQEFCLYESHLTPKGPHYRILKKYKI